jgi:glycerol uptake facilitator-like aquaporin
MSARPAILAEFAGTAALLATIVGSGIMGETLSPANPAVALLANSLATGAALFVLVATLGPISGAHLNPLVTVMAWRDGLLGARAAAGYLAAQFVGASLGVVLAHLMFGLPALLASPKPRAAPGLWLSELVATVVLLAVVRACRDRADGKAPALIALTVLAGYWATASTFFVNPAVTLARTLTPTFAGIRPADAPAFLLAQMVGLVLVALVLGPGRASPRCVGNP